MANLPGGAVTPAEQVDVSPADDRGAGHGRAVASGSAPLMSTLWADQPGQTRRRVTTGAAQAFRRRRRGAGGVLDQPDDDPADAEPLDPDDHGEQRVDPWPGSGRLAAEE